MPQPIINDILPLTQIFAGSSQTVFSTNWTANAAADVTVYDTPVGNSANDVLDLVDPTEYTVQFIGQLQTVQVTFIVAPPQNDLITITRMTPVSRKNLYTNTNFTPSMLNNDFEIFTLEIQENELVNQQVAPRYNYSQVLTQPLDTILPILGPNQFWAKDAGNTTIVALDIGTIISGGTVTDVNTGLGLTGGPITTSGTISFAAMSADTFWGNITGSTALPTQVTTEYFLQTANNLSDVPNKNTARSNLGLAIGTDIEAWSAALDSIAALTTVANNLIYTTASNTYHVLAPVIDSALISSHTGVPTWTLTLPQGVQTNIQYLGVQNQALDMGGFQIKDGADPTQPTDFATKNYVDLNALTGTSVYAASAATLGTVTQSGSGVGATLTNAGSQATLALDNVNPPLGVNVLIKNTSTGATAANEGIYKVTNAGSNSTNWVLTRAITYDTPTQINQTGLIIVQNGDTLAGTAWYNTNTIVTVDVTSLSYSEFGNIVFPVTLAHGGTNANLTASNGGIFYSTASAGAILSGTSTAQQLLMSGASTTPQWSTTTYPLTNAINTIMYASSANVQGVITPGNNGVMVSSSAGVPSWNTSLGQGLAVSSSILSVGGANNIPFNNTKGIQDNNGNNLLIFNVVASAVNYLQIQNDSTGNPPAISALGTDGTVPLTLTSKNSYIWMYDSTSTIGASLRWYNAAQTHFTALKVATAQSTDVTFTLPAADGATGTLLQTNGSGVLSFAALGQGLANPSATLTVGGANNIVFNDNSGIQDTAGIVMLVFEHVASATNYVLLSNNSTTHSPFIQGTGTDTNVTLQLQGKGTGGAAVSGTSTNDNAPTGFVGEYISASVGAGSNLTSGTIFNATTIAITAGDWDVGGTIVYTGGATSLVYGLNAGINTANNAFSTSNNNGIVALGGVTVFNGYAPNNLIGVSTPIIRVSVSGTTNYYLNGVANFTTSTTNINSAILWARRRR